MDITILVIGSILLVAAIASLAFRTTAAYIIGGIMSALLIAGIVFSILWIWDVPPFEGENPGLGSRIAHALEEDDDPADAVSNILEDEDVDDEDLDEVETKLNELQAMAESNKIRMSRVSRELSDQLEGAEDVEDILDAIDNTIERFNLVTAPPTPETPAPTSTASATQTPPAATATATSTQTPPPGNGGGNAQVPTWTAPTAGNLDDMPKTTIELAAENAWFHRVFNPRLFHAPAWDGADSWYLTLAKGPNSGGSWTSFGNPGQVIYRATNNQVSWCIGVLTTSKWKSQFLAGANDQPIGFNVRIAPGATVVVNGSKSGITSDLGDILIVLPDNGTTVICTAFTTAAPTGESQLWWGPDDRPNEAINRIDAR